MKDGYSFSIWLSCFGGTIISIYDCNLSFGSHLKFDGIDIKHELLEFIREENISSEKVYKRILLYRNCSNWIIESDGFKLLSLIDGKGESYV